MGMLQAVKLRDLGTGVLRGREDWRREEDSGFVDVNQFQK